jgi:hypothetical protein
MSSNLATKQDILMLKQEVQHQVEMLRSSMTVRLGSIVAVAVGLLFAALRLT